MLRGWGIAVSDYPDDSEIAIEPAIPYGSLEPSRATLPDEEFNRNQLREILIENFSTDELHDIAFEMGIDFEILPGQNKSSLVRELIVYVQRRGRYVELVRIAQQLRPNLSVWQNQ